LLLAFIAYAFVNNSNLKLINQAANTGTQSEVDTSTDNAREMRRKTNKLCDHRLSLSQFIAFNFECQFLLH